MPVRIALLPTCIALSLLALHEKPAYSGEKKDPPPQAKANSLAPVVPGFSRMQDPAQAGRLLLGELQCTNCHQAVGALEGTFHKRQAPILDGVGQRLQRSFLLKYLADPHGVKPGTTMPNVLAALPEKERSHAAEALAHFLASTGSPAQERADRKAINAGRTLYHQVGCVACHGTRNGYGKEDKLTANSVPLGDLKAKYTLKSLGDLLINPHGVRPSGRMPGILDAKEAKAVANYLLQGIDVSSPGENMTFAYYEGGWSNLPDFSTLKPVATGKAADFDITVGRRDQNMGLKFDGFLKIEKEGQYKFYLSSDDGSRLNINNKTVVNNDGTHATQTVTNSTFLAKGMHPLTVLFFNAGGPLELRVEVEGPGVAKQPLGSLVYPTDKAEVPKVVAKNGQDFTPKKDLVDQGRQLFTKVGCVNCHALSGLPKDERLAAPELGKLQAGKGCLADRADKAPEFSLNKAQRQALSAALKAPSPLGLPKPEEVIARTLTTFNCYACHERGKVGGPEEAFNAAFTTTQPEMGDEGRLPPILDGVGAKLTAAYMKHILANGGHDRPYMHTRMPRYGEANVGHLQGLFAAVDKLDAVDKVTFGLTPNQVKSQARHMVGATALGCIKCHTFAGHKAEGVQGIDMSIMTARVQRDWFHQYLLDPNKFRPGTRMPTAWPMGLSVLPKVLDGEASKQIEAIYLYLGDGKKALLPVGLKKQFMPLVPEKEAIIYRNFIEGAGSRAIGVGFPEKINLAFDANQMRLAMIWQGSFIDASRHWTDRGAGYEPPLGDNILQLPAGPTFAVLAGADTAWPTKSAKEQGYQFLGYRLTPDQRPTFLYSMDGMKVEDTPNAVETKTAAILRRTLRLTSERLMDDLYLRAALADKIQALGNGAYRINAEQVLRLQGSDAQIRQSGGKMELLAPIRFKDGAAEIVLEYEW